MLDTRLPPPLIDGLALLAVLALWHFAPQWQWTAFPQSAAFISGGLMALFGLWMAVSSVGLFKKKDTTILPFKPEKTSALVETGFYRATRNPMYLGMALVIFAVIIATRQPLGLLPLLAACLYLTRFQIIPEERALEQKFGQDYLDYKSRVRRWI